MKILWVALAVFAFSCGTGVQNERSSVSSFQNAPQDDDLTPSNPFDPYPNPKPNPRDDDDLDGDGPDEEVPLPKADVEWSGLASQGNNQFQLYWIK